MLKNILLLIVFNILFFIIINNIIDTILEKQNILNINNVKSCINKLNPKNLNDFKKDIDICAKEMRNLGAMGDMFAMLPNNKKIIWDASTDCKLDENKSYLKKDYICDLFYDKESCIKLSNKISKQKIGKGIWYFNEDPELVNFDTYYLKENNKTIEIRIASGGEKRDLIDIFKPLYILIFLFDIILLIILKQKKEK